MSHPPRLVIGISGASGSLYGIKLLEILQHTPIETHLVLTKSAGLTITSETGYSIKDVQNLANVHYASNDIAATIASGSFLTMGMVIAPCSIRTMSAIATGLTDNLITRAADVTLKERRKLVLMVRESPFHLGHLRTMTALAEMGAIIAPPVPALYAKPDSVETMVEHTVGRVLDLFGIPTDKAPRWEGKI